MRMQSLTRRTMFIVLAAELLCAFVFSRTALWHEERTRVHSFDVMLWGRSDSVLGAVQDAEDANANVTLDPRELKLPEDDIFAVYNYGDRMLGSSSIAPAPLVDRRGLGYSNQDYNGHRYRLVQRDGMRVIDREKNGRNGLLRPITIVYAARTDGMWHDIHEAANYYMVVSAVLLIVTAALLMLLLRQALRPLDELAARAKTVSKDSLVFEAPKSALRIRELAPLAETLSLTIASLRKAFENEARFVGDAAHELKTAVAVVRSTVQLMMMRARTPEEITQGLDRLLTDNQRVEELVARMLTLARMDSHSEPATFPIDITETARRILYRLQPLAEAHDITVHLDGNAELPVLVSAEHAETLVSNLTLNAIQYSAAHSEIEVKTSAQGSRVVLQVSDHGVGISAGALSHVFERFYRADISRSRDTGGAGLGLAICKSIVDAADGTISIESKQGAGTTVTVAFDLALDRRTKRRPDTATEDEASAADD